MGAVATRSETIEVDGVDVPISNPGKVFFPALGFPKMDLVRYYLTVMPGVLAGCRDRPTLLKRHPDGVDGEFFYQKRVPSSRPPWLRTATVHFPSGRSAEFLLAADGAHVAWAINLGCIEINPWPVRAADLDHPDELRVDIDPTTGIPFADARDVTMLVGEVLEEHGLTGFPKTSGKRGMHVNVRIEPTWEFPEVRKAALALAREVERRAPSVATTAWWKEERHGVFIDYNQNARDRTVASAYSVRAVPDARVSCPLEWDEVPGVEPAELTMATVPERFASKGDPGAAIDARTGRLDSLLELSERQERDGLGEAPYPPHFPKAPGEPSRVQPSKAKRAPRDGDGV
jgi:bifunctional non-homologous end joining protein LigD